MEQVERELFLLFWLVVLVGGCVAGERIGVFCFPRALRGCGPPPTISLTVRLRTSVVASSETDMLYVMCRNSSATRYIRPSCSSPNSETNDAVTEAGVLVGALARPMPERMIQSQGRVVSRSSHRRPL